MLFYFIITATIKGEAIIIPNLWLQKQNGRNVKQLTQGNVTSKGQHQRESMTLTTVLWWLLYRAAHVLQRRDPGAVEQCREGIPVPHAMLSPLEKA